jgi:chromosome segregation ATPase
MKTARTDVKEMAIKQLEEKIAHLQATTVSRDKYNNMKIELEDAENTMVYWMKKSDKHEGDYNKEHSIVINLDAECENLQEQLRQSRNNEVRLGQELEHLRPLMVLYMKEKVSQ